MEFLQPFRHTGELNQVERWKLARHPLEVADAVIARYALEGADSIATVPGEAERLKWVGIYPQRQGGDAFMLRLKVPGGRLEARQARRIGEIAEAFSNGPEDHPRWGNRYCDITTRQDIQIHWVRIEDVPEIWRLLEEVDLTSVQACGDSARNVLGCPVAGVDADEMFDATPIVDAISGFFTGNREYANLPRKFKMSVTGCLDDCAQAEINDIGLWPARLGDGTLGFNLLVGGGLSDGPRMASDIDVFVGRDEALECTRAIAQTFGELGNRENRGFSRMRYLVQELGPEQFRAEIAKRAAFELRPAGETLTRRYRGDHVGVHAEHDDDRSYVGCAVPVGRLRGSELIEAARLAETYGDGSIRLATDQNFVITGVTDDSLDEPAPLASRCSSGTRRHRDRSAGGSSPVRGASSAASRSSRPRSGPSSGPRRSTGASPTPSRRRRPGELARRRDHPHALLGVSRVLRAAADRRHRISRRDRASRRRDRRGGRHRSRWQPRHRRAAFARWVLGAVPVDDVPQALGSLLVDRVRRRATHRRAVPRVGSPPRARRVAARACEPAASGDCDPVVTVVDAPSFEPSLPSGCASR